MELLHPHHQADVDLAELYHDPARVRPDRPYVLANMVASADGATQMDGRSGGLGDEADRALFRLLRFEAPVVLVGASTVRAERYKPSAVPGQRIAVVTRSLQLDLASELFADGRGMIVTTEDAGTVPDGIPVVRAGKGDVDLRAALAELGAPTVLTEGGPSLVHQLIAAGLLDELCLTAAPWLIGGSSPRVGGGHGPAVPAELRLVHVARSDQHLFLRYARAD